MIHTNGNAIFDFPEQLFALEIWNIIYNAFFDCFDKLKNTYICFGGESFSLLTLAIGGACISVVLSVVGFVGSDDYSGDENSLKNFP